MARTTTQWTAIGIGAAATIAVWIAIGMLAPRMWPVGRESSADFWNAVAFVDLTRLGKEGGSAFKAVIRDDGAWVYGTGMDSAWVGWAPRDDVINDFPLILKVLQLRSQNASDDTDAVEGYRRWKAYTPGEDGGPNGLIEAIEDARQLRLLNSIWKDHPGSAYLWDALPKELGSVADKTHHYWANIVFEALFIPTVFWFFLWPWVKGITLRRRLVHAAVTPFLMLTPLWMGYCVMTRHPVGPNGGVLYPWGVWILQRLRFDTNAGWEISFFRALPKLFGPMSQGVWDDHVMYDNDPMHYFYTTGPIQGAIAAAILCAATLVAWYLPDWYQRVRKKRDIRGFEVVHLRDRV